MNYNFYAYISRMKFIQRWSLMHSIIPENIMEHSEQVAQIAFGLAVINNKIFNGSADVGKCVSIAIFHDVSEVITGDLPTPVKYYNKELNDAYKGLESVANNKIISMLPDELKGAFEEVISADKNSYEAELVKAADKIAAYVKCVEELKAGNKEFTKAKKSNKALIDEIELPEVKYFMDKFIKGFELSLDELE
ncbi:MAG TPA: 5'-deoxynucleotidase [Clostridia bacterium]|nr:5'-deoxynucleotidase [Clostridia bacterium]